jgi:spore coat polysaccharide biosynthesis protein SpsF (cytidylyltransferase family)
MNNEDIIRMAREALEERDGEDYYDYTYKKVHWWGKEDEIVKFAELVAAAEREACAKLCEEAHWSLDDRAEYAAAIRARGRNETSN